MVEEDPASGNCELDGLPTALEGRWSGDVGEGNLLQCKFSQPAEEKKNNRRYRPARYRCGEEVTYGGYLYGRSGSDGYSVLNKLIYHGTGR